MYITVVIIITSVTIIVLCVFIIVVVFSVICKAEYTNLKKKNHKKLRAI